VCAPADRTAQSVHLADCQKLPEQLTAAIQGGAVFEVAQTSAAEAKSSHRCTFAARGTTMIPQVRRRH
jgi:hypothetical protein